MRLSLMLNCVAEQVIKHFLYTCRGNGLTEARAAKIAAWNEAFNKKGTGATKHDVAALEKKLKVPIIVKIFPDRIFYSSGCYRKAGAPIKIIDHNFHAWGVTEGNFPGDKTVKYYHGDMIDWIHVNRNLNPVNVWLFSSGEEPSSNTNFKQPICYDQFVKSSGEIYQTEHLQCEMTESSVKYKVKDFKNGDLDAMSKRYEEELKMYSRKVELLEKEKNDLQIRFSSYAAARMTNENPYIKDLNDPNRPTKISERYSELYDNHWTDAFVNLQDKHQLSETEAIEFLLDVLYVSFVECKQARLQKEIALQAINQYIGSDGDDQDLTVLEVMKTLKYVKRTNIKRKQKVFKESVETKLINKTTYEQMLQDIRPYLDECVEVCLLMNIQEPPLELRGLMSSSSPEFDVSAFRSYTKFGKKMYYVVWPALHLFYDGPLLCKGIAHGMPEPSDVHKTVKVKDRQSEHN